MTISIFSVRIIQTATYSILIAAKRALQRPNMVVGSQSPYTFTLSVPSCVSGNEWLGLQCEVKTVTWLPHDCSPTAASTTSLSAPPIPKSGCKKAILRGCIHVASK
mmetsp:Transcript_22056/g.28160  ORF Transcript_22056/g.28160 Transcript_22056/m.28160 type:complete len:106 (+) Transcript_22056:960-1277(+)